MRQVLANIISKTTSKYIERERDRERQRERERRAVRHALFTAQRLSDVPDDGVYGPRVHIFQLCFAYSPSPSLSLTDIQLDSMKSKRESSKEEKLLWKPFITQIRHKCTYNWYTPLGAFSKPYGASNTSDKVTSVCSVFNWRKVTGLTRDKHRRCDTEDDTRVSRR